MPLVINNINLRTAAAVKNDEFYTPRAMIEAELAHYPAALFQGKRILCNCDDPDASHFYQYFADNFRELKLRRLVGIRFSGSKLPFDGDRRSAKYAVGREPGDIAFKRTITPDKHGNKHSTGRVLLDGGDTGGFSDREGMRQLADCDIVITNPPFSRFREYMALLMAKRKKFIIIGSLNAVSYKEIFPLIQSGKVWLGAGSCKGVFTRPDDQPGKKLGFVVWFTNLPHTRRENAFIPLTAEYKAKAYPTYVNYPAIEVSRTENIPANYYGLMGVPISFIQKHNPAQFEIVDINPHFFTITAKGGEKPPQLKLPGSKKDPYARLIIRAIKNNAGGNWIERKDLHRNSIYGNAGGFVYVVTVSGERGYKIGKAENVANRVKRDAFSRQKPKVVMSLEVHNRHQAEKQIHDYLRLSRQQGTEWFDASRKEVESALSSLAGKKVRLWR